MAKELVIYHGGCWDGFCAAWLLWRRFPDAEFVPAQYGDAPPDVKGKHVYIVDFTYDRETLMELYAWSASLVVLDHHKSARKKLEGLPYCVFDSEKSGARLTHEYIDHAIDGVKGIGTPPHWLVSYTEDRDLYRWELPNSREINAWLRSYRLVFEFWEEVAEVERDSEKFFQFVDEGSAILRNDRRTVESKLQQSHVVTVKRPQKSIDEGLCFFSKWRVANATTLISETGHALADACDVGCCWFELPSGERVYSLRSRDPVFDVSAIAEAFGGGGHATAAAFKSRVHPWEL